MLWLTGSEVLRILFGTSCRCKPENTGSESPRAVERSWNMFAGCSPILEWELIYFRSTRVVTGVIAVHDVTGRVHMLFQDAFMTRPGFRLPVELNQCT
jgi:hypothetical protein